ncbi:MAG: hypothetical protein IAE80_24600 [Anaerolinea sp.]|nr:hypothetical protein [Anaerolinea sp.]
MTPLALVLFVVFAVILFGMYIAIRRRLLPPSVSATLGVFGSVVAVTLMSSSMGNHIVQAIFVGLLVGGLFSAGVLALAWYFQSNEKKKV